MFSFSIILPIGSRLKLWWPRALLTEYADQKYWVMIKTNGVMVHYKVATSRSYDSMNEMSLLNTGTSHFLTFYMSLMRKPCNWYGDLSWAQVYYVCANFLGKERQQTPPLTPISVCYIADLSLSSSPSPRLFNM
jgi:hypothetical protein